jgi:hypothetical protein
MDSRHDVFEKCLKLKGKWWANHFFYNKEVGEAFKKVWEEHGSSFSSIQKWIKTGGL